MTLDLPALDASADYLNLSRQAEDRFLAKEYSQAAALWERALALNPHVTTWAALGKAHYLAQEYGPAIVAYEKALELGAGYRWASAYDIACCYALQGDKQAALDWLEKAMDLGFRDLAQVQQDQDLQSLHAEERFQELALVTDVDGMSRDEGWRFDLKVLAVLDTVISQDNRMWPRLIGPGLMRCPQVLHGLNLIPNSDQVELTVRDPMGGERTVVLLAYSGDVLPSWITAYKDATAPIPLTLKNRQTAYWYEYLPDMQTVFCQYNAVKNEPDEPLDKFCTRLFACIDANKADRLILDMRWTGGGNNFLNKPLVEGLMRCDSINQQGKLFVIIGRNTFSAAQCGVTQIERYTNAIFVGEPTGSRPNFIGESIPIHLPYSKMAGTVSDLYWQNSVAMDYRTWIAPELYAPPTFAAYRANRDPALEAILAYHSAP